MFRGSWPRRSRRRFRLRPKISWRAPSLRWCACRVPTKSGSGFLITETGVIATNAHLALGEASLMVILADGQQIEGKVVYTAADKDIALLKVEGGEFPHLTLAGTSKVR